MISKYNHKQGKASQSETKNYKFNTRMLPIKADQFSITYSASHGLIIIFFSIQSFYKNGE